jgi:hypothetical protein
MTTRFTVLFDACVLYSAPLRDMVLNLAMANVFHARWTDEIHEEWTGNLLANRPDLTLSQVQRTRELMNKSVPDCLVTGYQGLIPSLSLPDPDDRHVLAAAIHANAATIVTQNLKDFPMESLRLYHMEVQHPDDFFVCQFDLNPVAFCTAIKRQRSNLKKPPVSVEDYLGILSGLGMVQSVELLKKYSHLI